MRIQVFSATFHNHFKGSHAAEGRHDPRIVSIKREDAIIGKINAYAEQATLLTPQYINKLATAFLTGYSSQSGWRWISLKTDRPSAQHSYTPLIILVTDVHNLD